MSSVTSRLRSPARSSRRRRAGSAWPKPAMPAAGSSASRARIAPRMAIGIAAALVFIIEQWVPLGRELLYPLTLFTTWVHEMGHGLTAIVMGGHFDELVIRGDASGYAMAAAGSRGWPEAAVMAGGLLAPPILGSFILGFVHGPRRAKILLAVLAAALIASVAIYV